MTAMTTVCGYYGLLKLPPESDVQNVESDSSFSVITQPRVRSRVGEFGNARDAAEMENRAILEEWKHLLRGIGWKTRRSSVSDKASSRVGSSPPNDESLSAVESPCFLVPYKHLEPFKFAMGEGGTRSAYRISRSLFRGRLNMSYSNPSSCAVVQEGLDYGEISGWMEQCRQKHDHLCSVRLEDAPPLLRAIDCVSSTVVQLPAEARYVALSYSWGDKAMDRHTLSPSGLPASIPLTIRDAMEVCRHLGIRYLWVDRYCIDQDDSAAKHAIIRQMDRVYRSAALTIVAAAGNDPEFGLPGVSVTPKTLRVVPTGRDGENILILPRIAPDEFHESTLSTRGWTYQEGLLARRRLVFLPSQVYFQCLGGFGREACPNLRTTEGPEPRSHLLVFPRDGRDLQAPAAEIWTRINEYSTRNLTFSSDMLNAFLGVLRAYERRGDVPSSLRPPTGGSAAGATRAVRLPVYHIFGLPLFGQNEKALLQSFTQSLLWGLSSAHIREHKLSPFYRHHYAPKNGMSRVAGLPSWSWVGWTGFSRGLAPRPYDRVGEATETPDAGLVGDIDIHCSLGSEPLRLSSYVEMVQTVPTFLYLDPCLRLSAWTTPLDFIKVSDDDDDHQVLRIRWEAIISVGKDGPESRRTDIGLKIAGAQAWEQWKRYADAWRSERDEAMWEQDVHTWPFVPYFQFDGGLDDHLYSRLLGQSWLMAVITWPTPQEEGFGLVLDTTGPDVYSRVGIMAFTDSWYPDPRSADSSDSPPLGAEIDVNGTAFVRRTIKLV
ncbi:heterokaryon incompatibility protein-domain-containing protein [Echria macrotheca]|uniref:Heterokaryon incompatibility protein-domain-containing protein n=1 Tax=Echria macrotheca TaxID=438768 RepID=A0AAJ0BFT0_9PEZI|nr:heterokaryon incompatibility protein-domain-containing protein [Echria macrotheca]